jgi:hypothetical protein
LARANPTRWRMMFLVEATALRRSSLRAGLNHRALGPDPHLQRVILNVDPLDEELNDCACSASTEGRPDEKLRRCSRSGARERRDATGRSADLKAGGDAVHNPLAPQASDSRCPEGRGSVGTDLQRSR